MPVATVALTPDRPSNFACPPMHDGIHELLRQSNGLSKCTLLEDPRWNSSKAKVRRPTPGASCGVAHSTAVGGWRARQTGDGNRTRCLRRAAAPKRSPTAAFPFPILGILGFCSTYSTHGVDGVPPAPPDADGPISQQRNQQVLSIAFLVEFLTTFWISGEA